MFNGILRFMQVNVSYYAVNIVEIYILSCG